jgi:hypothetical protein
MLPSAADVPVPPGLAGLLGYPCVPPERFVCFTWWLCPAQYRPALVWDDGVGGARGDEAAWAAYVGHPTVGPGLAHAVFGKTGRADDALLVDTAGDRAFILSSARGRQLARITSSEPYLPLAETVPYGRAADQVLRPLWRPPEHPPVDRPERLRQLARWLDGRPARA